jgi:hypothetical protein
MGVRSAFWRAAGTTREQAVRARMPAPRSQPGYGATSQAATIRRSLTGAGRQRMAGLIEGRLRAVAQGAARGAGVHRGH